MKYEEKFIVINTKRLKELDNEISTMFDISHEANDKLIKAIDEWSKTYREYTGKNLDQKYYVVNQDEPYADEVWELIKNGEESK